MTIKPILNEHLFENMRIQKSDDGKRANEDQAKLIIQTVLEIDSEQGIKRNQTELQDRIKEFLNKQTIENGSFAGIKPMVRNTIHKHLLSFYKAGKIDKDEQRRYSWTTHYDKFKRWNKMIQNIAFELKQNSAKLEELFGNSTLKDPKTLFEEWVFLLIPAKEESELKYRVLFAPLAGMSELAPKIWDFYQKRLQQVKNLQQMPKDATKSVSVENEILIIRKKIHDTSTKH